jgi:hypothetical protein
MGHNNNTYVVVLIMHYITGFGQTDVQEEEEEVVVVQFVKILNNYKCLLCH